MGELFTAETGEIEQNMSGDDMCDPLPAIGQRVPDADITDEEFLPPAEDIAADLGKRESHPRGSAGIDTQSALQNSEKGRQLLQHESSSLAFFKKGLSKASKMCGKPSRYGEVIAKQLYPSPPEHAQPTFTPPHDNLD